MCAVVCLPSSGGLGVTFGRGKMSMLGGVHLMKSSSLLKWINKVPLFARYLLVMLKKTTWRLLLKDIGVKICWWQGQLFSLPIQSLIFPWICLCSCGCWAQSHVRAKSCSRGTSVWGDPTGTCHWEPGARGSVTTEGCCQLHLAANFKWIGPVIAV